MLAVIIIIIIIIGGTIVVIVIRTPIPIPPDPPPCPACGVNLVKWLGIAEVVLGILSLGLLNTIRNRQKSLGQ